jgi:hypothetical protein
MSGKRYAGSTSRSAAKRNKQGRSRIVDPIATKWNYSATLPGWTSFEPSKPYRPRSSKSQDRTAPLPPRILPKIKGIAPPDPRPVPRPTWGKPMPGPQLRRQREKPAERRYRA